MLVEESWHWILEFALRVVICLEIHDRLGSWSHDFELGFALRTMCSNFFFVNVNPEIYAFYVQTSFLCSQFPHSPAFELHITPQQLVLRLASRLKYMIPQLYLV